MIFSKKNSGFTLIEILIVVGILGIIIMSVSLPSSYYKNESKLRAGKNTLLQTFSAARHMTLSGKKVGSPAVPGDFAIFLEKNSDTVKIFWYAHDFFDGDISDLSEFANFNSSVKYTQEYSLQWNNMIEFLRDSDEIISENKILIYFDAPLGKKYIIYPDIDDPYEILDLEKIKLTYKNTPTSTFLSLK